MPDTQPHNGDPRPDAEAVRPHVSPGEPHDHRFEVPGLGWVTVARPSRGRMREIQRRLARSLSSDLRADPGVLDQLDGKFLRIEAVLSVCVTEAPSKFPDGRPLFSPATKETQGALDLDEATEEEIDAIWLGASDYLARFGVTTRIGARA